MGRNDALMDAMTVEGDVPGATTGGEMIPPVVMEWSYGTDQTMAVPGLGVDFWSGSTGATQYLIEYVTVTFGDLSTGEWFELPFQGGYKSSFVGSTGFDVTLSDALFFVSPTEIPLDNLRMALRSASWIMILAARSISTFVRRHPVKASRRSRNRFPVRRFDCVLYACP
jgi:hypothetical protein